MKLSYHYHFEPASDASQPALLLLHGTGGDEFDLLDLGRTLSPGSALLSPRGPVSEGGAWRFFARLGEGRFDPREVAQRTHALADFVQAAAKEHGFDARPLIAVGFSNGANVAATMLQLRPGVIQGAALLRPMVVLDQPAPAGMLSGVRVLQLNGAHDPIVPTDHPERLARLLRSGGAQVDVKVLPASHGLTSADVREAQRWVQSLTPAPSQAR